MDEHTKIIDLAELERIHGGMIQADRPTVPNQPIPGLPTGLPRFDPLQPAPRRPLSPPTSPTWPTFPRGGELNATK